MQEELTNSLEPFIVKESSIINYLFGSIFFLMSLFAYFSTSGSDDNDRSFHFISFGMLFPALFFFIKAIKKNIVMHLDKSGFYYRGKLITTWNNFVSAYITALERPGSLDDSFVLVLEYYTPEKGMVYRINLNMDKSQDKSDNEIMEAIKIFSENIET